MNHATRPCSPPALASAERAGSKKSVSSEYTIEKTRDSGFDPLISRFDPCSPGQKSAGASETRPKLNKAAHTHTSPSHLQNKHPHAEQRAKNPWQPKCGQSARARSATPPRRGAQCAASQLTRPARFQPSRPLSCDADLDGRRDEQNGPADSRADAAEGRTTDKTLDGVERNASSRLRRGTT